MNRTTSIPLDIARLAFWYPLRWVVLMMPFSVTYRLAMWFGYIHLRLMGAEQRKRLTGNIRRGLNCSQQHAHQILLHNSQCHLANVLELMKYSQIGSHNIDKLLDIRGLEHLDAALSKGHGALLMTAHFGAKQALQIGLGSLGYKLNQINYHMQSDKLSWVQRAISQSMRRRIEDRMPLRFIPATGFMRDAIQCLKNGEILIVAGDGIGEREMMNSGYEPFQLLGNTMLFPVGGVQFAQRAGADLLPIFVIREQARHHVHIMEPIEIANLSPHEATQKFVSTFETMLRQYPHLWEFWRAFDEETLLVSSRDFSQ